MIRSHAPPAAIHYAALRHLIVTVHGIRTFGDWQPRLAALVKSVDPSTQVLHYRYGYFSVLAFMVPPLRWILTRRFRTALLAEVRRTPWDRIDIVAHSFGTHLVAWGLYGMPPRERPVIHTVLLSGSVLRTAFPWHDLLGTSVQRLVNDCGTRDAILVLNQLIVLLTGMAGRVGFIGMVSDRFCNRFFRFGHSGYFLEDGRPSDAFMREEWLPVLTTDDPPRQHDDRDPLTDLRGFLTFCLNNAEPIKLVLYLAPLIALTLLFYTLYRNEQAARNSADARLAEALVSRGDADANDGEWERAERAYAEARALLAGRQWPTLRADLALWNLYRESPPPLYVSAPYDRGVVTGVVLSHDGRDILTSHSGGAVSQWDLRTGRWRKLIAKGGASVSRLVLDGDTSVRIERSDGGAETIDIRSGRTLTRTSTGLHANRDQFVDIQPEIRSPDGRFAMVGMREPVLMDPREQAETGNLTIVDLRDRRTVRTFHGYADHVTTGAFSDDGRLVVFATRANRLELWPLAPLREFRWLTTDAGGTALAISPSGAWLLTSTADNRVVVGDIDLALDLRAFHGHEARPSAGAFCGDSLVVTGDSSGGIRIGDLITGEELAADAPVDGGVAGVSCSSDGRRAVAATVSGTVVTIDPETRSLQRRLTCSNPTQAIGFDRDANIGIATGAAGEVRVGRLAIECGDVVTPRESTRSRATALAADGRTAAWSDAKGIAVWDVAGRRVATHLGVPGLVNHIRLSEDGRWLAVAGNDSRLRIWDVAASTEVRTFVEFPEGLKILHVSRTLDRTLSSTAYGGRVLWDFARGPRYLDLRTRIPPAIDSIRIAAEGAGDNGAATALLGEWYAFRGEWTWAADLFDSARTQGGVVPPVTLARTYWQAGDRARALKEMQRAANGSDSIAALYAQAMQAAVAR